MVARNQNEPAGADDFADVVKKIIEVVTSTSADASPRDTLPKDDPNYLAKYATSAEECGQQLAEFLSCPCPRCKLSIYELLISQYVCLETVRAAVSGDESNLKAILDLIEKQKKSETT